MQQKYLLIATAVVEGGTGLVVLVLPRVPLTLLLGIDDGSAVTVFVARIAGSALVAIAVGCWMARNEKDSRALVAILAGVLFYDLAAAAILAYAGLIVGLVGVALWPAVVVHVVLAVWCIRCIFRASAQSYDARPS
jgi:hypothetical protein